MCGARDESARCDCFPSRSQAISQLERPSLTVRPPGRFLSRYAGHPHDVGNDRTGHRSGPEGAPQRRLNRFHEWRSTLGSGRRHLLQTLGLLPLPHRRLGLMEPCRGGRSPECLLATARRCGRWVVTGTELGGANSCLRDGGRSEVPGAGDFVGLRRPDPGEMGWSSRVSSALTVRYRP